MQDIINAIGSVMSSIWTMMQFELLPGIKLSTLFIWGFVCSIAVWFVCELLSD